MFKRICIVRTEGVAAPNIMECFARAFRRLGAEVYVIEGRRLERDPAEAEEELARILSL